MMLNHVISRSKYIVFLFFLLKFVFSFSQVEELEAKLQEAKEQNDQIKIAEFLNKIGFFYWEKNQHEKAIEYFDNSITRNIQIGNNNALRTLHSNVGTIYLDLNKNASALKAFQEAEKYSFKINDKSIQTSALLNTANALKYNKQYQKAIEKLETAFKYSKELKNNTLIRSCYGAFSENYKSLGNETKSYEYFNLYATFNQHMHEEELEHSMKEHQNVIHSLESEKNAVSQKALDAEKKLEKSKELLEAEEELNRANQELIGHLNKEKEFNTRILAKQVELGKAQKFTSLLTIGLSIILGLFTLTILIIARKRKKINNKLELQKDEIEKKSIDIQSALEDIKDKTLKIEGSINYAERIQRAMLPEESLLKQALPESFIYFRPRDGVSGDFYWFVDPQQHDLGNHKLTPQSLNQFLISAIDCTGHGVPGAFMSMLSFNMLNNIIKEKITSPDEILNNLHVNVRDALKQKTTSNRDGMDMALCSIYKEKGIVEFAGAKNPLVYIQDNEVFHIKGDKHPIGGNQKEEQRKFTKHSIKLREDVPTYFYLFSDGFPDQFGGEKGRKFMIKNLKILLLEIHRKPMEEQKEILSSTFKKWMGYQQKQIDDVLIIGFKID